MNGGKGLHAAALTSKQLEGVEDEPQGAWEAFSIPGGPVGEQAALQAERESWENRDTGYWAMCREEEARLLLYEARGFRLVAARGGKWSSWALERAEDKERRAEELRAGEGPI